MPFLGRLAFLLRLCLLFHLIEVSSSIVPSIKDLLEAFCLTSSGVIGAYEACLSDVLAFKETTKRANKNNILDNNFIL